MSAPDRSNVTSLDDYRRRKLIALAPLLALRAGQDTVRRGVGREREPVSIASRPWDQPDPPEAA